MRRTMLKRGSLLLAGAGLACLVGACWVEPEPLPGGGPDGGSGGSGGTAGKAGSGGGGSAGAAGKGNTSGAGGYGASGGSGGSGSTCEAPNPAGCASNACPPNAVCDQTLGCLPSSCACGDDGLWTCTEDCGGGVCVPVGPECNDATAAIGAETAKFESCTAVVRLRYGSLTPLGWQLVCGDYGALTEDGARALAGEATGFGAEGELVSGEDPADEWVFWEAPGDFGGVGVISARSPFAVFGGGVIWDGRGDITYPAEWRDPSELGFSCANSLPEGVPTRGFNLGSGMPLSEGEAQEALRTVYASALPMGLAVAQDVLDALVLFYPPTVGVLDPTVAEYVVFLNSGIFQF